MYNGKTGDGFTYHHDRLEMRSYTLYLVSACDKGTAAGMTETEFERSPMKVNDQDLTPFLGHTSTIESKHESIVKAATKLTEGCSTDTEKATALFYFVRDSIPYNLYMISVCIEDFRASKILEWGKGYCVQKAVLLTALGRAAGIPSRLIFAQIRNHRIPPHIFQKTGTNIFPRHGYNQFFLDGKWITAAATFDRKLCEKNGLSTVEFDGKNDALLPKKDLNGNPYIEYVEKFPPEADLPFEWIAQRISAIWGTDKRSWLEKPTNP